MKKILLSILTIALVAVVGVTATRAYFTDTETSLNNTLSTGTIDISVDDQNSWSKTSLYALVDMKPDQIDYTNFVVKNVGTNPVNVYKKVQIKSTEVETQSEPGCDARGGTWTGTACTGETAVDLGPVLKYDLSVVVKDAAGAKQWEQVLYKVNGSGTDTALSDLSGKDVFLGMIPEGWTMEVTESYHMDATAGNEYQGEKMTFDITLTGEQLKGTAVLEDKDTTDWRVKGENTVTGTLTYGVKDSKFNYSFTGVAPLASTNYSLVAYYEAFSSPADSAWPRTVEVLGTATSDGAGNVSISATSVTLAHSLLNMKIWLVKSSDISGGKLSTWTPSAYLFDTGLVDYYKVP